MDALVSLYKEMSDLTKPLCGGETCGHVGKLHANRCCEKMYCEMAIEFAKDYWNKELVKTDHPTLPLMGKEGCTAEPHLRPVCARHLCKIAGLGFIPEQEETTKKYFNLLDQIEVLENQFYTQQES